MLIECLIDLTWIDIKTTCDDHILFPVNNKEIIVFIPDGNITGIKPPILELSGCLFRVIPIPLHDQWALDDDLARFSLGDLLFPLFHVHQADIRIGPRDSDSPHFAEPQDRIADSERRCLAHTPPLAIEDTHVCNLIDQFNRHGGCTGVQEAQFSIKV